MARHREGTVAEPLEALARLEQTVVDPQNTQRIRFLTLLRRRPEMTYAQVAEELRSTSRTVRRWWRVYQQQGIQGLLNIAVEEPPAVATGIVHEPAERSLVDFLNRLQPSADPTTWFIALRSALIDLVDGVHTVSIALAGTHGMYERSDTPAKSVIRQVVQLDSDDGTQEVTLSHGAHSTHASLTDAMRAAGMPVELYHSPTVIPLEAEGENIGSLILWALKTGPDVPPSSVSLLMSLRPFLGFLLSDSLLRVRAANPGTQLHCDALNRITSRFSLTARELEVLTLHIFGRSNAEIAERLFVSVNTVRKHVKSLHRKTGCSSYNELLALYLHPSW